MTATVQEMRAARIAALEAFLELLHDQRRELEQEIDRHQAELERHKNLRDGT